MKIYKTALIAALFSFMFMQSSANAGEPSDQLSGTINKFLTILTSTPVSELQANGLPESARKLVFARFDFSEMAQRSLANHWKTLDANQQKEFVAAFAERLLYVYGRNVRSSADAKIQFGRELREGQQATVQTTVTSDGDPLAMDYQMHNVSGQWKVYDVVIDHVSMVNNYRAQFDRVIAKSSVKELLERMKDLRQRS